MTAANKGAHIANYVEMVELLSDVNNNDDNTSTDNSSKKGTGCRALDRMTGK
jgi:hypothetical protein